MFVGLVDENETAGIDTIVLLIYIEDEIIV